MELYTQLNGRFVDIPTVSRKSQNNNPSHWSYVYQLN